MRSTWKLGLMIVALLAVGATARAAGVAPVPPPPCDGVEASIVTPRLGDACYVSESKGPYYYQNEYEMRARKLARGVANVTLCVAEIPNQMFREAYKSSPVTGGVVGIWKGVVKGSKRLAIGTWEIVTFYVPGSSCYQPYIEPEVVFMEYLH